MRYLFSNVSHVIGRSLSFSLSIFLLGSSLATSILVPSSALGTGWTDPLSPMPGIATGFLASSCNGSSGYVTNEYHIGNDYGASVGTAVRSIGSGTVIFTGSFGPGLADAVFIKHKAGDGSDFVALYGHITESVTNGSTVTAGQQIGTVADITPLASHLHLGIRPGTTYPSSHWGEMPCSSWPAGGSPDTNGFVDPVPYLNTHPATATSAHWIPLAGDWTGKGYDSIGLFNPNTNIFYLRNSNTPGNADTTVAYGNHGWLPIVGDWDGNGTDTIGLYDPTTATFYLRNSNTAGNADVPPFAFGNGGNWVPLVGDWDGNGTTTVGVYDPTTARFYLRNSNTSGNSDFSAILGNGGSWIPIVGDWDGNGSTTIGVDNTASTFYLSNSNSSGIADVPAFTYGNSIWTPVMGNWDGNGNITTTVGVYDHSASTFYLRNSNSTGNADITVPYGNPN